MLKNFIRFALVLIGLFGLLIFVGGLQAVLAGVSIVLPGLGLVVSGGFLVIIGLLIIAGAVTSLSLLSPRPKPYRYCSSVR